MIQRFWDAGWASATGSWRVAWRIQSRATRSRTRSLSNTFSHRSHPNPTIQDTTPPSTAGKAAKHEIWKEQEILKISDLKKEGEKNVYLSLPYLYMTARAIAQVSKVKGQWVRANASFHHKTKVSLMSPTCPAHILIMKVELLLRQEHTTTQYHTLLFISVVWYNNAWCRKDEWPKHVEWFVVSICFCYRFVNLLQINTKEMRILSNLARLVFFYSYFCFKCCICYQFSQDSMGEENLHLNRVKQWIGKINKKNLIFFIFLRNIKYMYYIHFNVNNLVKVFIDVYHQPAQDENLAYLHNVLQCLY